MYAHRHNVVRDEENQSEHKTPVDVKVSAKTRTLHEKRCLFCLLERINFDILVNSRRDVCRLPAFPSLYCSSSLQECVILLQTLNHLVYRVPHIGDACAIFLHISNRYRQGAAI